MNCRGSVILFFTSCFGCCRLSEQRSQAPAQTAALPLSAAMNHFQTILPRVRMLLSSHPPSQVQALLDNLLEEELLSREYHCALLHEPDGEALARKISLTLLQKGDLDSTLLDWACSGLHAPAAEGDPSFKGPSGELPSLGLWEQ